jgi:hypothetical protein
MNGWKLDSRSIEVYFLAKLPKPEPSRQEPEPSTKISPSSSVAIITPQASIPASSQSQCHPLCQDKNQNHSYSAKVSSNLRVIVQKGIKSSQVRRPPSPLSPASSDKNVPVQVMSDREEMMILS